MKRPVRHSIFMAAVALAFGEAVAAPATPEEIVRGAIARDLPFDQLPRDENGRILSIESARSLALNEADFEERFGRHYKAFFASFTDAAIDWEAPPPEQSEEPPKVSAREQARAGIEAASANPPWMPVAADAAGRLADQTGVVLDKIGTLGGYASMADAAMLHEAQGKGSATGHFAASVAREQAAGYAADKLSARFPKLGTFVELLDIYSDVTAEMEKEMDSAQARGGSLNSAKARGIINTIKKRTFIGTLEQALNEEGMAEVQNELATGHYSWSAVAYRTAATTIGEVTQMNAILRYGANLHYGVYEAEKSALLETAKLKHKLQVKALSSDAGLEAMRHRMIQLQLHPHADSPAIQAELAQLQSRYDSGIKGMRELGKRMIRDFGADSTVVEDLYKRSQIARNAQRSELLEAKMARIAVARDEMDVRTWLELRDLRDDYRKELADFREATKRLHKERGSDDPLVRDMMNRFQAMRNASNAMDAVEFDAHAWRHREIDKDRAARERELQGYADLLQQNAARLPEGIRLEGESLDELVTEVDHLVMKQARGEVPADADLVALAAASHARELRYRELRAQQQAGLLPEDADLLALLDGPGEAEGDSPEAPPPAPETDASAFAGITDSGAATDMDESGLDTDAGEIEFTAVEVVTEPPPYVGDPIIGRNPDGSKASQRGEWDGHEHGATIRWKNGQMEIYAGMHRGQRHGPLRNYTNGVLTSESYFRDGKRHGPSRTWSAAGRLLGEYWFKEDGLHGWSRVYEEGQDNPYSEQLHVDRQLRVERLWTRDGEQMLSEKILAPDQTVLLERQWDPDTGILKSEVRRQHPPPASGLARTYRGLVGGSSDLYDERRWDAEGNKVGVQLAHKGSPPHCTVYEERYSESGDLEYRHTHVLGKGSLHQSHYRSRDGKELRHGTWRDFFPERRDTLAFSPETVAEFRDGLAHGRYQRFHPNGKLREEGEFSQGLPHGTWREYDDKGVILSVSEFSNGQFNGIQKRYYTGELGREITVNGTTVTRFRSWHNGELMKDLEGVVGDPLQPRAIPAVEQRLNQIPRVPGFSGPKEELVTGKGRVWAINPSTKARVIQGEFELKDGKPHGRYRGYFWSGELRAEEHSRDGLRHGICSSWLEDGRLEAEVTYVDGVMQGPGRWLDTRSGKYREFQMRDDVVIGWTIDYHPNGAVNRVLHYLPLSPEAAADPRRRKSTNYRSGPRNEYDFGPRIGPWAVFDDTGRRTGGGFWIIDDGRSRSVDAEAFSAWLAANPQYGQVPRTLPISPD